MDAGLVVLQGDGDGWSTFGYLARAWRRRCGFRVIGITGSSGKTTTKELVAALLGDTRTVVASHANYNNELGVPLTLLGAAPDTDVVICEMGMRGSGQIAYLCDIAEPDVGVLTYAGSAHLELLGSLEAIAAAKAEIIAGTRADGTSVVPSWQPELLALASRRPATVVTFGEDADADVRIIGAHRTPDGIAGELADHRHTRRFSLPMHGLHHARNLAAAVAAAVAACGEDAVPTLELAQVGGIAGRGRRVRLDDGTTIIDEAYNANPESMRAALSELAAIDHAPRRVAVLGHMAELGNPEVQLHRELGAWAAALPIDLLVLVDERDTVQALGDGWRAAGGGRVLVAADVQDLLHIRSTWMEPGDAVLMKASNSVGLGRAVDTLVEGGTLNASIDDAPGQGADT